MRYFPLGDVLSVATGRVVSRGYQKGLYGIVEYMWGQSCDSGPAFIAMYPESKLWMLKQFPQFKEGNLAVHVAELDKLLNKIPKDADTQKDVVCRWLDNLCFVFGERFQVAPIPKQFCPKIDIVAEMELLIGPGRVIKV